MEDKNKLHPIEKTLLKKLANSNHISIEKLSDITNLSVDQVRRGVEWLKYKNLISIKDKSTTKILLGKNGLKAIVNELPERRLVEQVKQGYNTMSKLWKAGIFEEENEIAKAFEIAVHRNKWLVQEAKQEEEEEQQQQEQVLGEEPKLVPLPSSSELSAEEIVLKKIYKLSSINDCKSSDFTTQEELNALNSLKKRPHYIVEQKDKQSEIFLSDKGKKLLEHLIAKDGNDEKLETETEEHKLTSQIITSGRWKHVKFSSLDVEAPAPLLYSGRKHPLQILVDEIKEVFVGMGFSEIDGPIIQSSFWNFDVLFTPQDHPAREMQDTFYIRQIRQAKLADDEQYIDNVSKVHRNGWRYEWDIEEAKRTVLRTHTTPITIRYLSDNKLEDARVFTVGRVFRNEKTSYKHLVEFNQIEGIVTSSDVTLRDLMGLQTEFYAKLGIKKVKFWPTYFPYTEPSLQSMIFHDKLDKWVELFGMGVFRPEVTQPLGIRNPVLAWGGGIERIAMLRFGLNDVRDLYANSLSWLRGVARYQL